MDLRTVCGLNIPEEVDQWCKNNVDKGKYFVSYLVHIENEMVERVFAARRYKRQGLMITEVMRNATGGTCPVIKNLTYSRMAGYTPVFSSKDIYYHQGSYPIKVFAVEDFDVWEVPIMPINVGKYYINLSILSQIDEFKWCGYSSGCGDVISYLDNYRKDNSIEMFGKMGLKLSPVLRAKAQKDKQFRRFLWEHHNEVYLYGVQASLYAYSKRIGMEDARRICYASNQMQRLCARLVPEVKGTKIDRIRLLDYLEEQGDEQGNLYDDYLKAIKGLGLDLSDTKNIFPKELRRMHDMRSSQYASMKAKQDEEKRRQLYEDFRTKSKDLQRYSLDGTIYSIIIPSEVSELLKEGEELHHCVGKMGYDKKVVDGISLIALVRKKESIDIPFVTAEYRFDKNELHQCYGLSDSKPPEDVLEFVKSWADGIKSDMQKRG